MSTDGTRMLLADSQIDEVTALKLAIECQAESCRVVTTDSGNQAIVLAAERSFCAAVADMRLNDMSGLKLLLRLKALQPEIKTILMSDCGSDSARQMCFDAGIDFFFEKPIDISRLSAMLGIGDLGSESVFRGTLDNLSIPDVLQLVVNRTSAMLMRIDGPSGQGAIEIMGGQVIHARLNGRIGEQAFFELVGWSDGHFEVIDVVCPEERTIAMPLPELLMRAASHLSENKPPVPARDAPPGAKPPTGETFFPSEISAPAVNTVWENMSHYKSKRSGWQKPASAPNTRVHANPITSVRAYHQVDATPSQPLRFRAERPPEPVIVPPAPDVLGRRSPRPNRVRRPELPSARRMLLATTAAVCILFVSVRYLGLFDAGYARDVGPAVDSLVTDLFEAQGMERPSFMTSIFGPPRDNKKEQSGVINNDAVRAHMQQVGQRVTASAKPVSTAWPRYDLSIADLDPLVAGPNQIGVAARVFDELGLQANPWIELQTESGVRVGGLAVRMDQLPTDISISTAMAKILSLSTVEADFIRMRQVAWNSKTGQSLTFGASKDLPGQFCQYWYAVGVSLSAMKEAGLTPGSGAIIRGPDGFQPVRVQLVDRGNQNEIWLSKPVCEAVGLAPGLGAVKLFPKG